MISEEKLIQQMQKRKMRIIALFIGIASYCLLLGLTIVALQKVMSVVRPMSPYTFDTSSFTKLLPELLTTNTEISIAVSKTYILGLLLSCVLSMFIGMLIVEIRGATHARLIISMWKRLEKLEKDVQHKPSDGDKPAPCKS